MPNSSLLRTTFAVICALALASLTAAQTPTSAPAPAAKQTPAPKSTTGAAAATKPHTASAAPLALTTQKDKTSYAIGMNIGKSVAAKFKADSVDVNNAIFLRGMRDALAGGKMLLTDDQAKTVLDALQAEMAKTQEERTAAAGSANKTKGDAFLAANKTKDGVTTLPSGLQYKIITAGTGPKPAPTDTVVCNYRGTLIDGTEFDASSKHGGAQTFPVTGVIPGWTEALQLMPVGSKWQLFIPSNLAYGEHSPGGPIGPGSVLVFDIELVSIKK